MELPCFFVMCAFRRWFEQCLVFFNPVSQVCCGLGCLYRLCQVYVQPYADSARDVAFGCDLPYFGNMGFCRVMHSTGARL